MEKINNWEEIEAKGINDFVRLVAGGYEGIIKNAEEYTSESGNKSLKVECDICSGTYKDYFQKNYDNNTNSDKKWDNNSTKYIGLGEASLPFFKGFITAIENSNPSYKWNWNEKELIGKKIGLVYKWEEYEKQDGVKAIKAKLNGFRSIDKLDEITNIDNVKLLNGTYMTIDDYNEKNKENKENSGIQVIVNDDDLPF